MTEKRRRGRPPKFPWFRHVELYDRHHRIQSSSAMQRRGGNLVTSTAPPRQAGEYHLTRFGRLAMVGDLPIQVYGLRDLARIYELDVTTPQSWYRKGMLPPPFMRVRCGGNYAPLYTRHQMEAICHVINDIFAQGCTRFCSWHGKHIEMMRIGAAEALKKLDADQRSMAQRKRDAGGTYGVILGGPGE